MGAFIAMGRRVVKSNNICFFIIGASLSSMQRRGGFPPIKVENILA